MAARKKDARTETELAKIEAKARGHGLDSDEYKTFMVLRYSGMHVGCMYRPESKINEFKEENRTFVDWFRPMKGAQKNRKNYWKKLPKYPKHPNIDFNIQEFYEEILNRKRKNGYMYFYRIITSLGIEAGISDLSPNSLRNSHGIYLIDVVGLKIKDAADYMGCSIKTLTDHYIAYGRKTAEQKIINTMEGV